MSADCWRICPSCNEEREAKRALANHDLAESIEKDSLAGYRRAQKDVNEAYASLTETLREDYEMHTTEGGLFFVSYVCSCTKCGFAYTFKHEAKPDLSNKPYKKT